MGAAMHIDRFRRLTGLPLGLQLLVILGFVLIAAQAVTLLLTVLIPPAPNRSWDLDEVASALSGKSDMAQLERRAMAGPPDLSTPGWLVSESSREALAKRLGRPTDDVLLAFYTQLPVGGVAVPLDRAGSPLAQASWPTDKTSTGIGDWLIESAQAQSMPGGPPPGGLPGGGLPGGVPPGAGFPGGVPPRGGPPGGAMPQAKAPGQAPAPAPAGGPGPTSGGATGATGAGAAPRGETAGAPQRLPAPVAGPGGVSPGAMSPRGAPVSLPVSPFGPAMAPSATQAKQRAVSQPKAGLSTSAPQQTPAIPALAVSTSGEENPVGQGAVQVAAAATPPSNILRGDGTRSQAVQPLPFRRETSGIFALTTPPFIEGDFVAAMRQADGRWIAVAPKAEAFPNRWQRRVMLWFALSLALVAPLAWLFARRIVGPLESFARAAEMLGRDPSTTILPLSGPAEIGRAANAFNQMQNRLRAFVDDRTAMVGAISHDLRTPLTRLRFRVEDVPDAQREGILLEVSEMEDMITQVIAFIRDASTPGPREQHDLAALVAAAVGDARMVGGNVTIEMETPTPVDVDPVGIRRLLGNLLENAVKYGDSAKVRVLLRDDRAVAEIIDAGPGIPEDEIAQAFEPFFRSEAARRSGKPGSGLGLAVCRSIARAHGGDVVLSRSRDGFVASLSVPLRFDGSLRRAA